MPGAVALLGQLFLQGAAFNLTRLDYSFPFEDLDDLGYADDDIADLLERGVVAASD